MHLLDQLLWGVARTRPAVGRPAWLVGAAPQAERGILELAALRLEGVPEPVEAFYAAPERYVMRVQPRWTPPLQLAGRVWARLWAARWGQLALPLGELPRVESEVQRVDGRVVWVRARPDGQALYVSGFDVVQPPGEPRPCVRMTFEVPGGALVAVFGAGVEDGRLVLATGPGAAGARGLYGVPRDGPARYVSALREELALGPSPSGLRVEHTFRWWGLRVVQLTYDVVEADSTGRAW